MYLGLERPWPQRDRLFANCVDCLQGGRFKLIFYYILQRWDPESWQLLCGMSRHLLCVTECLLGHTASGRFWGKDQASGPRPPLLRHSSVTCLRGSEGLWHVPSSWGHQKFLSHQVARLLLGAGPGHSMQNPISSLGDACPRAQHRGSMLHPPGPCPARLGTLHKLLLNLPASWGAQMPG